MPVHKKQIRPLARLHGYWLYHRFLKQTQSWPLPQRQAWIVEKLKRTLVRAYEGVPFYRQRLQKMGFDPNRDFRSPDDLAHLPLLTKEEVRAHHEQMIDRRFAVGGGLGRENAVLSVRL